MYHRLSLIAFLCAGAGLCSGGVHSARTAGAVSGQIVHAGAAMVDITSPGDTVIGVPNDGDWPGHESPALAIDDNVNTKFLHFKGNRQPTGIRVTPSTTGMVVVGLTFTTANDVPDRDPVEYQLSGSNAGINGPYTVIASGEIVDFKQSAPWPRHTMNSTPIRFSNDKVYSHYELLITAIRAPGAANSMQVAEVELLGGPPGGWPPEVDAGGDRMVVLPYTTVQLDGSVSYFGGDPSELTLLWTVESGPAGVDVGAIVFEPSNSVEDPRVRLPAVTGAYTLRLTATATGEPALEGSDTVLIVVAESMCPAGDLNGDCAVDLADLYIMAMNWLGDGGGIAEIAGGERIDMEDYALLAENWGTEGPRVVINEFLASNNSKPPLAEGELLDEDGQASDWVELLNVSDSAVSLEGWYLTDNPGNLTKWRFPDVVLEPEEFLVVFASRKNRRDPEGELHTSFALTSGAGYIGLVGPDGRTVVHDYEYPPQFAGISYGLTTPEGVSSMTVDLVREGAAAWAMVPADGSLGLAWTEPGFDHSGWKSGKTAVGYGYADIVGLDVGEMYGNNESVYIRVPFWVGDVSGLYDLTLRMKYDDGFVAYINGGAPVFAMNAPGEATWNSGAVFQRDGGESLNYATFRLPEEAMDNLRVGQNVLAIHGLNYGLTSTSLLISPWLTVERAAGIGARTATVGFFHTPSPGAENREGVAVLGPSIREVTDNPPRPGADDDVVITARVAPTYGGLGAVRLRYRIDFGPETEVVMTDDGTGADETAGDGIYSAVIPHTAFGQGQMIRWYVTAEDEAGGRTREPMFLDPVNSPEYYGTVALDTSVNTNLEVFEYFVANTSAEGTRMGTRASVYYLGEFYDNVFVRLRGANTTHGRKFDFNKGHYFRFAPDMPRVDEINLNQEGADPSYIRQPLSWETYAKAGLTASMSFPMHVRRNGDYLAVRIFVEQPDTHLIGRVGLDRLGALYKVYSDLGTIAGEQQPRKISRRWEDLSDLQELVDGISAANPNWAEYMFDNINIAAVINYMTSSVILHENDHTHKNYFLYRDTEGTREWMFLPWDKDLTFGINNGIPRIIADEDWPGDIYLRSPSHPFYGDSKHQKIDRQWNRLFDAITRHPTTREMYLRRLRTLMDDILEPPTVPAAERYYERRIDELAAMLQNELGGTIATHVNNIKTQYLAVRRHHFFVNHSIHNPGYPDNAGIPDAQPGDAVIGIGAVEFNPASGNQAQEYIELINPGTYAVDISGWRLANAVSQTFAPGTVIPAGGTLYASPDAAAFRARTVSPKGGEQRLVQGNYEGHLSNWGETIELYDAGGRLVTSVEYEGNPTDAQRYLRISEMMYHPRADGAPEAWDKEEYEFLEFVNIGDKGLDLGGIKLTRGVRFEFPQGAWLSGGEYAVAVRNPDAFRSRYSLDEGVQVFGPYDGRLSNSGETIKLEDATNSTILEFEYKDDWYKITDGDGFSLTVIDVFGTSHRDWGRKSTWRPSTFKDGSPGTDEAGLAPGAVVINEVLAYATDEADWIELRNTTDEAIDIGGWFLSDRDTSEANRMQYEIAAGTVIPAGGYVVFSQDEHFGPGASGPGTRHSTFGLSRGGELVHLQSGVGGDLTGYVAMESFDVSIPGVTFGRYEKESLAGGYDFVRMETPTRGGANSGPLVGPVIMTEIMYHPKAGPGEVDGGEFIELRNITGEVVACEDLVSEELEGGSSPPVALEIVPWRFTRGIAFEFPPGVSIEPYGYLIIAQDPAAFEERYGATLPQGVQVLGPFANDTKLDNSGEWVTLSRPGRKEWGSEREYISIDSVRYGDKDPWPEAADGTGASLQHRHPDSSDARDLYTNDPANWTAAEPTPGR